MNHSASSADGLMVAVRNRWSPAPLPAGPVADWAKLSVAVVIPAYNAARTLPMTLASLQHQTYPDALMQVVVVDDGSVPPMSSAVTPGPGVRLIVADPAGWGRPHACQSGADAVDADVLMFIDSDMVLFPDHVEAHMRVHHGIDQAVVIGHKRFVREWEHVDAEQVSAAAASGTVPELFPSAEATEHWIQEIIDSTEQLVEADASIFRVFTGATGSMPKRLYDDVGGMDLALHLGEDTELGYRLAQGGAVFVPELTSSSWHLGATNMDENREAVREWNLPFLAHRIPLLHYMRKGRSVQWRVPLVTCVVQAEGWDAEPVRRCVQSLLKSQVAGVRVHVVAPWSRLTDARRSILKDPDVALYALSAWFGDDDRVVLSETPPADAFPSPFLFEVSPHAEVEVDSLTRLVKLAAQHRSGRVNVLVAGLEVDEAVRFTRTAAWRRALRAQLGTTVPGDAELDAIWGLRWADGEQLGISVQKTD